MNEAIKKLENKPKRPFQRGCDVVYESLKEVMKDFCEQDSEFSQAIAQSDKTLEECVNSVLKGHGACISDIEVYRKAVNYYFPGAIVEMHMKIHVNPHDKEEEKGSVIDLNLDDMI